MKKGDLAKKRGFTIIEVALVLAIAGLIFMMVFIALPALQRSQRDTRRRDDILTLLSNVKKYQTNNRGALPSGGSEAYQGGTGGDTTWQGFYNGYLGEGFRDPDGDSYRLEIIGCGASSADAECSNSTVSTVNGVHNSAFPYQNYSMLIVTQAVCNGDKVKGSSNPRRLAVLYRLEGAGVYCNNT